MTCVIAKPDESIDSLLKRFKKAVERAGILAELKKHEFYEKPSVRIKRKKAAAKKRSMKKQRKFDNFPNKGIGNKNFKFNKDKTEKIPNANSGEKRDYKNSTEKKDYKKNPNYKKTYDKKPYEQQQQKQPQTEKK